MDVVVEGVGFVVVLLQGGDEADQGAPGDVEDAKEVALLQGQRKEKERNEHHVVLNILVVLC